MKPAATTNVVVRDVTSCVCCGSLDLEEAFRLTVEFGTREAPYHRCRRCLSLQLSRVERPAVETVVDAQDFDVGAVQRSILTSLLVRAVRHAGIVPRRTRCLDFGAGVGLLVRLLRDQGIDGWGYDESPRMVNCDGFAVDLATPHDPFDLICLIEVLEHLISPADELRNVAGSLSGRGALLIRSELYDAQVHGPDWAYLRPEWGGHVNFASRRGIMELARRLGLRALFMPVGYCLLTRPGLSVPQGVQRLAASTLFLANVAAARMIGQCNFRHASADSDRIEAANLRRLTQ